MATMEHARHDAPERSLTQRLDALERANEVRTKRAKLKRDLKGGRCTIHALLIDPPACIETAKVFDMLLAVPKYGRVKVNKVLTQCRISPSKTIGGLSQRQRDEMVSLLRRGSDSAPSTAVCDPARLSALSVALGRHADGIRAAALALGLGWELRETVNMLRVLRGRRLATYECGVWYP